MKIVVAMDSFKGTMAAEEACEIICDALCAVSPNLDVMVKPMADGGEGTAAAMIAARNGAWVPERVTGPLPPGQVEAGYAWFDDAGEALVEMATASGLTLLAPDELNPLRTTTYGTGQLILAAARRGAGRIRLAVGGSATVDGGVGAAMAVGWRFLDENGNPVGWGGGELERIASIHAPDKLALPPIEVLCDVNNPLCGEHGAAAVYGPQKGATPDMVEALESGLAHLGRLVADQLGKDICSWPGAGAAGGLSAGAVAFMNAKLVPGVETVMAATGLADALSNADWVITGEGRFDEQSLRGKVVSGVARLAREAKTRVAVLAGSVGVSRDEYTSLGIEMALATQKEGMEREEALKNAKKLLSEAAQEFARTAL